MDLYTQRAEKRGIEVINFAADGDSCLLCAMRAVMNMTCQPIFCNLNIENTYTQKNPSVVTAMAIYETNTTCSLCTRHCAHWCKIEVKAAGNINKITHGFIHSNKLALINKLLIRTYGKAMHGLRWKDLSHRQTKF